jgi:hypothetical protein
MHILVQAAMAEAATSSGEGWMRSAARITQGERQTDATTARRKV